ncbi:MAG: hypothetical protein ACOYKM_07285 [Caulobacterales bacterium]|jgi:hypothetical protein
MTEPVQTAIDIDPAPRFPPLRWRRQPQAWVAGATLLSLVPILLLGVSFGFGLAIATGIILTTAAGLVGARWAQNLGRPPRARREIVVLCLVFGGAFSFGAPTVISMFSGAAGTTGYHQDMAGSLWPLALMIGLPLALVCGLATSMLVFEKPPVRDPLPATPPAPDNLA